LENRHFFAFRQLAAWRQKRSVLEIASTHQFVRNRDLMKLRRADSPSSIQRTEVFDFDQDPIRVLANYHVRLRIVHLGSPGSPGSDAGRNRARGVGRFNLGDLRAILSFLFHGITYGP
jgi:hypothetical protein